MKTKCFILLYMCSILAFSQDPHFSQIGIDRLHFNPSLIGNFNSDLDFRASMQRRSQWESVSIPFSTFSMTYEYRKAYKDLNIGIQFLNDKSGTSLLTLNQLNFGFSKVFQLKNLSQLSIGSVLGVSQKKFNYEDLLFIENEPINSNKFIFTDIGLGASYTSNQNKKTNYILGSSIFHLNRPNNSFIYKNSEVLPIRHNAYFRINYNYSSKFKINSEIMLNKQSSQKEVLVGLVPKIYISETIVSSNIYYRLKDAMIFGFGLEKNNFEMNLTYDVNISSLTQASENKGGFEFSIVYYWNKKLKTKNNKTKEPCPRFL